MIPKKIHYCWFGGKPLTELPKKCIESWKKFCPDYEIIEWNEKNFDVNYNAYVKEAYEAGKWAFVADVARLYALVHCGGIYLDTDVELLQSPDRFLGHKAFLGFEREDVVSAGLMATEKGSEIFTEFLKDYDGAHFLTEKGEYDLTTNVCRITAICLKHGLCLNNREQTINGMTVYPMDYFSPKDFKTKQLNTTENTVAIHHYDGSWIPEEEKLAAVLYNKYRKFLPKKLARKYAKFKAVKKIYGAKKAYKETFRWIKGEK